MLLKVTQNSLSLSAWLVQRKRCSRHWRREEKQKHPWRTNTVGEWTVGILGGCFSGLNLTCWRESIFCLSWFWVNWHWKKIPLSFLNFIVFFPQTPPTLKTRTERDQFPRQRLLPSLAKNKMNKIKHNKRKKQNLHQGQKQRRRPSELSFATTAARGFGSTGSDSSVSF